MAASLPHHDPSVPTQRPNYFAGSSGSGPWSYGDLDDLSVGCDGCIIFDGLQVELNRFLNIGERFIARVAFADAAGERGYNGGVSPLPLGSSTTRNFMGSSSLQQDTSAGIRRAINCNFLGFRMKPATPAGSRRIAAPRNMASILEAWLRNQQLERSIIIKPSLVVLRCRTRRAPHETRLPTAAGSAPVKSSKGPRSR